MLMVNSSTYTFFLVPLVFFSFQKNVNCKKCTILTNIGKKVYKICNSKFYISICCLDVFHLRRDVLVQHVWKKGYSVDHCKDCQNAPG